MTQAAMNLYADFSSNFQLAINQAIEECDSLDEVAPKALEIFHFLFGGSVIYIPKGTLKHLNARNKLIKAEFTGNNHTELAKKYGLSVQWVYKIVGN